MSEIRRRRSARKDENVDTANSLFLSQNVSSCKEDRHSSLIAVLHYSSASSIKNVRRIGAHRNSLRQTVYSSQTCYMHVLQG